MSVEREYIVVVHRGIDLQEFDAELSASTGSNAIPNRSVDIANPREGSKRMTHWMLTDEEAQVLADDPRVLSVEIPPDQRDDIELITHASQSGNFYRVYRGSQNQDPSSVNWGLRRCIEETNSYTTLNQIPGNYDYALDGTGVDIVIQDSGIDPDHPEWEDRSGVSRLQQINWYQEALLGSPGAQSANHYRDADGHGTHCAGISAGKTYGWAKGAQIFSQKLAGLETLSGSDGTGISIASAFDLIRRWHLLKGNNRPTVVNMSWGYGSTQTLEPINGVYRGTAWTYGVDYTDRDELWAATGVSRDFFGSVRIPVRVASVDAEIEDMIDAGIHVCIAAGNNRFKADVIGGLDYDNTVNFGSSNYEYHRGSSPYSDEAFMVGNLAGSASTSSDVVSSSTTRGPGVNIYAPGDQIMSASSTLADAAYTTYDYPEDDTYQIMSIGGTSMASPQVAGVCALHLQSQPNLTPAQLQSKMVADSKATIDNTGSDTDYANYETSLLGSPNRMLYSRYGVTDPVTTTGAINVTGITGTSKQIDFGETLLTDTNFSIEVGGQTYVTAVNIPWSTRTNPARKPVCLAFHGAGGNETGFLSSISAVLYDHIVVSVSVDGQNTWNISNEPNNGQDIEAIKQIIAKVKLYTNVDTDRIRILGFSNGGALALRAAVEIDDASIDVVCCIVSQTNTDQYRNSNFYYPSDETLTGDAYANDGYDTVQDSMPQRKILQLNGRSDTVVPYNGGDFAGMTFLNAADSAYALAQSQGHTGAQLTGSAYGATSTIVDYGNVIFLNDDAGHQFSPDMARLVGKYFESNFDITY